MDSKVPGMSSNNRKTTLGDLHNDPDAGIAARQPALDYFFGTHSAELLSYMQILPWGCLGILLTLGLRLLTLDVDSGLYGTANYLIWFSGFTAVLAIGCGLFSAQRQRTDANLHSQQPELWMGEVLLICVAFINAASLIETSSTSMLAGSILTMVCVAFVFPRWSGVLTVSIPQLFVVAWLAQQSGWVQHWLLAFTLTLGSTLATLMGYYGRQTYIKRHRAQLAARNREIEALQTEAVERAVAQERALNERHLSTLGLLAGGIAHDLNNILVPILGNASMLEESVQTSSHKQQAKEVMLAASRARSLTQQLGSFAARDSSAQETLNLNGALAELAPIVWRALPQGVDIVIVDNPEPVYLTLNRRRLQDLITNLLLEAGNATLIGGSVSLKVFPLVDVPKELALVTDQEYCAISIRDGAKMLEGDEKNQLLDFDRINTPDRTRGLGLHNARESAELLGGALTLKNAEKGGNQFCLFLPRRAEDLADDYVLNQRINSAVATEVLIVDDEPAVRNVSVQLLQRSGFVVRSCHCGEAALREIEGHLPDVIVMDLRMPGMGGRLAAEAIREEYPRLPIVFCTGFAGDAHGWLEHMPNCALLQKPYETNELISTVKRLLQHEIAED